MTEYFTSVVTGLSVQASNGATTCGLHQVTEMEMSSWLSQR
jgi:hypothetical protein